MTHWIDFIFYGSVEALIWLARLLGITYQEINVWLFVIAWPLVSLVMLLTILKLYRDKRKLARSIAISIAGLIFVAVSIDNQAIADPSSQNVSKVSNGIRFDIDKNIQLLKISDLETGKVVHAAALKSVGVKFIESKRLSEDYVAIREWTGGASCCFIVHAFQTKPEFKKVLEHNNDFFDRTELVVGKTKLELHKEPFISIGFKSHSQLKYNPAVYDLESGGWE